MCNSLTFLSHMNNISFFFLLVSFGEFQQENYVGMWGHYGSRIMGVFLRPFSEASSLTTNIFLLCGMGLLTMEDCAPFVFLGSWALVAPYLCFRFYIFNRPILEEYTYQVEGSPHLL
jgi:hypothetical protein